jgi:hypothetical protein
VDGDGEEELTGDCHSPIRKVIGHGCKPAGRLEANRGEDEEETSRCGMGRRRSKSVLTIPERASVAAASLPGRLMANSMRGSE